jgi:hypothetical protein
MGDPSARGVTGVRPGHSLVHVNTRIAIDAWARDVAVSEAPRLRRAVRDVIVAGAGGAVALHVVRCRLSRLTPEQHCLVVAAIVEVDESAA